MAKEVKICSRCNTHNPATNGYCRQCGSALGITTTMIKAKPRLALPETKGVRWHWAFLGALIILGLMTLLIGALFVIGWLTVDIYGEAEVRDLGVLIDDFLGLFVAVVSIMLISFGFGGMAISLFSSRSTVYEPGLAALMVLILLGIVGIPLTEDAPVLSAIMVIPAVILAWLGARLGALFSSKGADR
jgi:hypothetical protein